MVSENKNLSLLIYSQNNSFTSSYITPIVAVFFLADEFISEQINGPTYRIYLYGSTHNHKGTHIVGTYISDVTKFGT